VNKTNHFNLRLKAHSVFSKEFNFLRTQPTLNKHVLCILHVVKVRRLGNLHRYTVQCVLPVNLFNEKIFLFIWFWLVIVAVVTCVSTLAWILRAATRSERHRYALRYLNIAGKIKVTNCSFVISLNEEFQNIEANETLSAIDLKRVRERERELRELLTARTLNSSDT